MVRVAFSNHVLDVSSRRLMRDGEVVHLAPKAMDLLLYLVARSGRYVSKQELQRELWSGVHVGQASLPWLVKELRRGLGPQGLELVRTLHGRGYQFAAAITELDVPGREPQPSGPREISPEATTAISLPADFEAADPHGLVTLWPPGGPSLALNAHGVLRLGRATECEIFLPYDKVSRTHAEIVRHGPALVLRDLGSTNGSHADGERVRGGVVLRRGQLVRLGEWLGLLTSASDLSLPHWIADAVGGQDWSGRVRELEARCRARLAGQLGLEVGPTP